MGDERVLLTGKCLYVLADTVAVRYRVIVTTRSDEKGKRIVESVKPHQLSYVVVDDIAKDGAFDQVFQSQAPFDYVIHTASPYHLNVRDPVKDFLDPAKKGTTGVLKSIKEHGPSIKRVVITSSSVAILNPSNHEKVYDETFWAPITLDDAMNDPAKHAYGASKVLAEKAAWAFVADEKPDFDLAVINCTYVFGPIQRKLPSLDAMNTSNHRIRDMIQGKMKGGLPPTMPVFTWVDVRDVALAHLRAMAVPSAGGHRFYVVGGHFSNKQIADVIRDRFPSLADRLPADAVDDLPGDVYRFNNSKSREVLGIEYTSLEKSTANAVLPRQVITQTITYADYTTTAVVTLGPGDPSSPPAVSTNTSGGSQGLSSSEIGIIIGSVVGAIVVALFIWVACIIRKRMIEDEIDEYENETETTIYTMQYPPRTYWPEFPRSITPPAEPNYRAVPPEATYTANRAARRGNTPFIFYDTHGEGW
ncbi:hypothetical protein F5Y10DRAFT_283758 [Nemania abortiva]|nr:hypothetical protein F5Y10DRAFT_283758 [Nemania abortiva]